MNKFDNDPDFEQIYCPNCDRLIAYVHKLFIQDCINSDKVINGKLKCRECHWEGNLAEVIHGNV